MGTYTLTPEEIADAMEQSFLETEFEGDFTEEVFIEGARLYLARLRDDGVDIPKD